MIIKHQNILKKNYLNIAYNVCQQIFGIFLIAYLFFFLVDEVFAGFMSDFVNLNYLLILVIISGIVVILLKPSTKTEVDNKSLLKPWQNSIMSFVLGFLAMIVTFINIFDLGILLSIIISILSGVLIWMFSYLFITSAD